VKEQLQSDYGARPAATLPVLFLVLAAMFVLVGCGPAGPRAVLKGERLIREQKYALAVQELQEAIRLIPTNAQAWNHLGLALHHNKQPKEALKAYRQALALDRKLSVVHYNVGCLLLEQNDPAGAVDPLTSYTYLQPRSAPGWLKLGTAQLRARRFDAAETSFKRALDLDPANVEAANNLGVAQANRRRPFEALASFNQALRHESRCAPALLNASIVTYQQLNNPGMALQKLRQYTALKPQPAHIAAVTPFVNRLDLELNSKSFVDGRTTTSPSEARTAGPLSGRDAGPSSTATSAAPAIAQTITPQSATSTPPVPVSQTNPPPRREAIASPNIAPRSNLLVAETLKVEGRGTASPPLQQSNPSLAGSNYTSPQPARVPSATSTSLSEGRVTRPQTQAVAALVHQIPPRAADVEVTKLSDDIVVLPAQDVDTPGPAAPRPVEARTAAPPSDTDKRSLIARINPFARKPEPSTPDTSQATRKTQPEPRNAPNESLSTQPAPRSVPRYSYTRPRPGRAGNRNEASRVLGEGVKAHQAGRLSQALTSYERAAQLDPVFFEAQYNLGLALSESGNVKRALTVFEIALALRPDSVDARYNFALALKQGGFFQDSAEQLEQILTTADDTRAHLSLANLYAQKLNQPTLARLHYRRVLEKEPQHPQAADIRFWLAANSRG
jgi:tetratricopeptide (TPR) repeat protein